MKRLSKTKKHRILKVFNTSSLVTVICVVAVCGIIVVRSKINHFNNNTEMIDLNKYNVPKPDIKVRLLTKNINSRPGIALKKVNGIVVHYTANPGTDAMANRNYFESRKNEVDKPENKVSSHFIIGIDGKIVQCIPLDEISYASNNRNSDTISIECCHPDKFGKFSEKTYSALIRLSGWLCAKYSISKNDIIRHYDVTGKLCPIYYVKHEDKWKKLKDDIWDYIAEYK